MTTFKILILSAAAIGNVLGHKVRLCEHSNYEGKCIDPDISENCYDISSDFNDMASSINTREACVLLWEHGGCRGDNRRVAPGTPSHENLDGIGFNDMASSLQLCPKEPKDHVKFLLYDDSNNPNGYTEIRWGDQNSMRQIGLNGYSRIKFYIHGMNNNAHEAKAQLVKNVYLRTFRNQPVILVDWGEMASGSIFSDYDRIRTSNVPRVAEYVARFISDMRRFGVIRYVSQVHVIGHSLGGQMGGLIGQEIQKQQNGERLGRITALDPAGIGYKDKPRDERLDEMDGLFVDAIHTSYSIGYYDRLADADFFANPGRDQPGECNDFQNVCNHNKVVNLFAKSIYNKSMYGCRVEGSQNERQCKENECNSNVVVGDSINERVRGEFCFMTDNLE